MGKSVVLLLVLVFLSGIFTFLPVNAKSRTIVVPDDYLTIAAAVGNATEGDTIFVKKGIYEIMENRLTINQTLTIIGEDQAKTVLVSPLDNRVGYELLVPKVALRVFADNFEISDLTITNSDFGVSVTGNGTKVNHITTSGIYFSGSHCTASENDLSINCSRPNTIAVEGSFNNITYNSFLSDFGKIECEGSFNLIIGNAEVINGIEVTGESNFVANNYGRQVSLSNSNLTTIYDNSVSGISLQNCYNNTVCGNIVEGPESVWGVLLAAGSGNVFYGNNITGYNDVPEYGVAIGGYDHVAEENLFYHNNFVNNYKDVSANWPVLGVGNYWDNGVEGNYWDGYSGVDDDGDGIGDVVYTIRGRERDRDLDVYVETVFGEDHYPLMAPFDISRVAVELPNWAYQLSNPLSTPSPQPSLEPEPDISEPFPAVSVAAASAVSIAVVSVVLLVYFKKRKKELNA